MKGCEDERPLRGSHYRNTDGTHGSVRIHVDSLLLCDSVSESVTVKTHFDLRVYQAAELVAMVLFERSKAFPVEERFSLTDQLRRSSRAVAALIAEAWRRRLYPSAFVNKLNEAEAEAAETQTWIRFAWKCGYLEKGAAEDQIEACEAIIRTLVNMAKHKDSWTKRITR